MSPEQPVRPSKPIWTYAYRMIPPQSEHRLRAIKFLLEVEHAGDGPKFEARFVVERRVTDILIVTDSPDQTRDANRRLEAEIERLNVAFSLTAPLPVAGDEGAAPAL